MPCTHDHPAPPWPDDDRPSAVIDIQAELRHWEACYPHQPFHRPGTPFRHYVPTLKFAYDLYLLSHGQTLQALLPALPSRYAQAVTCGVRLDWAQAEDVIACVWARVHAPRHDGAPVRPPRPDAPDERAILAAALRDRRARRFTQLSQR